MYFKDHKYNCLSVTETCKSNIQHRCLQSYANGNLRQPHTNNEFSERYHIQFYATKRFFASRISKDSKTNQYVWFNND